jgi:urease accessory protein
MYDGASLSDPGRLQRAVGELRVTVRRRDCESVLDDLRQFGCLKARFPRRVVPGWMDIVMLNTGGGVAGGDRLDLSFHAAAGAQATIAAQAAERFYRATAGDAPSHVRTSLSVAEGAALEWLPQETILFDRSALDRRLEVCVAPTGRFLGVETLVFGRAAMGETVRQGRLRDLIRVRRGGDLLLHDAIRMDGDFAELMERTAVGQGAHVLATIVYVAPDAEQRLEAARSVLERPPSQAATTSAAPASPTLPSWPAPSSWPGSTRPSAHEPSSHVESAATSVPSSWPGLTRPSALEPSPQVQAAASAWNGMLVVRVLGHDSAAVRATVTAALEPLRDSRPLPRVWLC